MDICIITTGGTHMECVGFLLDIFKSLKIRIYHPYNDDLYKWIDYFEELYTFEKKCLKYAMGDLKEIEKCKKIINITANKMSDIFTKIKNKKNLYEIHHAKRGRNMIFNVIRLIKNAKTYDRNKYKKEINCYSIFEGKIYEKEEKNKVMWVGWCAKFVGIYEKNFKDWDKKMKYKLEFFWTQSPRMSGFKKLCQEKGRENIHEKVESKELPKILKNVKFIMIRPMCKKCYGEVWSGGLTIALSHDIPVILSEKYQKKVEVPGITYKEDYNEVYDRINNMTDEEYEEEVEKIKRFKMEVRGRERKLLIDEDE